MVFASKMFEKHLWKSDILRKDAKPASLLNPIQDGLFRGCSGMEWAKRPPIPKICHTYPTMMKLGTVIPYLKKIQKLYISRDTPLAF